MDNRSETYELELINRTLSEIERDDLSYSTKMNLIHDCFSYINPEYSVVDKLGYSAKEMILAIEERQRALVN